MDNHFENKQLNERSEEFCIKKHFENPFIKQCISEFVEGHTRLYRDVVSTDKLMERLETNLDKIFFAGYENSENGESGQYMSRIDDNVDPNSILIFAQESDLDLSEYDKKNWQIYTEDTRNELIQKLNERKENIKSILLHELAHAAYTIKEPSGCGEKHIFSITQKNPLLGKYTSGFGNNYNVEAIVNYISSRIEGRSANDLISYEAETKAIYMLAEHVDEKKIIEASWNSDEQQYKKIYIDALGKGEETGLKSYYEFQKGMGRLIGERSENDLARKIYNERKTLSDLSDLFCGKKYELDNTKMKEIERTHEDGRDFENNTEFLKELPKTTFKENKVSFTQKIAYFLCKHQNLMNVPFVKNFVEKRINTLPSAKEQQENETSLNEEREKFINRLSNNSEYTNNKPIQHNEKTRSIEPLDRKKDEEIQL